MHTKSGLRIEYREKRNNLSKELFSIQSQNIVKLFSDLDCKNPGSVLTYAPLSNQQEFDPTPCTYWLQTQYPEIILSWPKTEIKGFGMDAFAPESHQLFKPNSWGILEPSNGQLIDPLALDLVLVPLLAFDTRGYRVGYGKGFYDRFFARCRKNVLKIGFSFFEPVVKIEDIDQFDVPLSHCITPSGIYEF